MYKNLLSTIARGSVVVLSLLAFACTDSTSQIGPALAGNGHDSGAGGNAGSAGGTNGGAAGAVMPGAGGRTGPAPKTVVVINPGATTLIVGGSAQFTASVRGGPDSTFTWSVVESSGCGTIDASGNYTAPAKVPTPAFCHVKAGGADAGLSSIATVNVVAAAGLASPTLDTWVNVTPSGVSLDPNNPATNFGVQDVVADPVRQSDLYAFVCYQGVWKSTDYGSTWKKVSTGTNADLLAAGRPWTAAIDNSTSRDPLTAPALYTASGYGTSLGVYKSTDGGVNWTTSFDGQDVYSFEMDPYDNEHLLTGMHESPGIAESQDAGATWTTISTGSIGKSIYPHFIDTGVPKTTRLTWLLVPQIDSGSAGFTTDGGATYKTVDISHPHGGNQLFNDVPGTSYAAGTGGVWRTTDTGATWEKLYDPAAHGYANGVLGTAAWLYSWDDGANASGIGGAYLYKAPRNGGTPWTAVTGPAAMNNGAKRAAVTYDGAHYIIVSGNWNAGIWRYVEP